MRLDEIVARHQRTQRLATSKTAAHVAASWRKLDKADLSASWAGGIGADVVKAVSLGQLVAATTAQPYVDQSLAAQRLKSDPQGTVNPRAFAGVASDGRPLDGLMYLPVIGVKQDIAAGRPLQEALNAGLSTLTSYAVTMVADAGRAATSVARIAQPRAGGFIRDVSGSCCARCAILAGRWYRWNADFERHAGCQCTEVPAGREGSPADIARERDLPNQLFREGRIRGLSEAETQAIKDGADLAQVVNAHRGMYTAGGRSYTREGTTSRGFAGKRLKNAGADLQKKQGARYRRVAIPRLTPEQIYREAGDNRAEAQRLLYRFGYLT